MTGNGDADGGDGPSENGRRRVIEDLVRWKIEYERFEIGDGEIAAWRDHLEAKDDDELAATYRGTVGEWLCSRSDLDFGGLNGGEFVDEQYERLLDGRETDYGYIV